MADLTNHNLIITKGWLFLLSGILSAGLLLAEQPSGRTLLLIIVSVWSFCRFYYFAFYVIQHYVDPDYRFTGLWDFVTWTITSDDETTSSQSSNSDHAQSVDRAK